MVSFPYEGFELSDLVRHKPGCTAIEDGLRLEISDLDSRGIVLSKYLVAKTKALISFAVTFREADLRLCFCICKKFVFS